MKNSLRITTCVALMSLLFVSICCFVFTSKVEQTSVDADIKSITVVVDAGHGGEDGGASVDNILEKNINLSIALKLRDFLISNGFDVIMTRETDAAIYDSNSASKKRSDLQNRVDIFNSSNNNVVISIHQNKFAQSQYSGTQVFYSANNSDSAQLAEDIRHSVVSLLQKDNERQCKKAGSEIFVLDNSQVPTVLVECGFLSNQLEASKLNDEKYQSQMAYCIFLGFMEYYFKNYL